MCVMCSSKSLLLRQKGARFFPVQGLAPCLGFTVAGTVISFLGARRWEKLEGGN